MAYAYATSTNLIETARNLQDAIVDAGFTKFEAAAILRPEDEDDAPLFAQVTGGTISERVEAAPDLTQLPLGLANRVEYHAITRELEWTAPRAIQTDEKVALMEAVKAEVDRRTVEKLYRRSRDGDQPGRDG